MNLTDTFYVALCMTILILGVVYWFWTQNQYMQRKLNLLENIVFEIKTQIQNGDTLSPPSAVASFTQMPPNLETGSKYPPAPSSELGDDEDLLNEELEAMDNSSPSPTLKISDDMMASPSVSAEQAQPVIEAQSLDDLHDDDHEDLAVALQPGGVGSGLKELPEADSTAKGNVLEGMTLKELQRLAEQKGISTARLRKPQLIEVIRAHSRPTPFEASESALE